MNDDRIFERNKLESSLDFLKNRSGGYRDRLFSGGILCKEDHETETGSKGSAGWDSDNASCSAAYSSRILPAIAF